MSKALVATAAKKISVLDAEYCIKYESDFINTKYHNICTGDVHVVPTGVFDYMIGIPLLIILVAFTLLCIASVGAFIRGLLD